MKRKQYHYFQLFFFFLFSLNIMAQSEIIVTNATKIIATSENTQQAAKILKTYLDKAFTKPFEIASESRKGNHAQRWNNHRSEKPQF